MKRYASFVLVLGVLALAVLAGCKVMSSEDLKNSIEVLDYTSTWVSKYYQPWPPRLILVPQISFRIKNIGLKPLSYVNFNAVYQFKGDPENFGDAFKAAIRGRAIPPGGTSDVIVLKSNLGVEGKNLAGIRDAYRVFVARIPDDVDQLAALAALDEDRIAPNRAHRANR